MLLGQILDVLNMCYKKGAWFIYPIVKLLKLLLFVNVYVEITQHIWHKLSTHVNIRNLAKVPGLQKISNPHDDSERHIAVRINRLYS